MFGRIAKLVIKSLYIFLLIFIIIVGSFYIYFRYVKETTFRVYEHLSPALISSINSDVDRMEIVNGMQVVKVDLNNNVRYVIHTHWKNPKLLDLYSDFSRLRIASEIPVFTKDDEQNSRIIRLMNHQFECTPYKNTLSYKLVPAAEEYISIVCSIIIPPAYSEFKGFVVLSLSREPTDKEKAGIRLILEDISYRIYKEIK